MPTIYSASWVLADSTFAFSDGAIAVTGRQLVAIGKSESVKEQFPGAEIQEYRDAVIIPGLVNTHSHLELTAMRGFLEDVEWDFFAWLRKLTLARLERMNDDDLLVSATWGACEAARAGVTCVADASDSALQSMKALRAVGLRGIVFQESFGPDRRLAEENFEKLKTKISSLKEKETSLVACGVSPHAPYTVCAPQLEMIARFALDEKLPLMMHAAETEMEVALLRDGTGAFAEGLQKRGIEWNAPKASPIQYLKACGVLETRPLLAHCIHVDADDLEVMHAAGAGVAHCPKSNAKLRNGVAPFERMLEHRIAVGLGSDSVASNNTCDLLEEARFASLMAHATGAASISAEDVLHAATADGATALGLQDQIGELKVGKEADFAVVSLAGAHQLPVYRPENTLIFSSSGRDVVLTVVAGQEVYRDGRLVNVDEERLRARIREISEKLATS
jgi:5-methylthioadenosine/S-adenosylhomocysteine deaminase